MNAPQTLYVNPSCLKCISGTNLSPANKNLFTITFTLQFFKKIFAIAKSLRISTFNHYFPANLFNNSLASCSLINIDFLLSFIAGFDKSIVLPFLVFTTFGFLLSAFFSTLQTIR